MYITKSEDENVERVEDLDDNCYYINSVISPYRFMKEQKREKQLVDYNDTQAGNFILLNNSFNYFEHLIEGRVAEKEARKGTGLSDELLFRIAMLNNKIFNHGK